MVAPSQELLGNATTEVCTKEESSTPREGVQDVAANKTCWVLWLCLHY